MASDTGAADRSRRVHVRGPQSMVSGLAMVALAALALWLIRDLPQGTLRSMGPGMLPRALAVGVALCGLALCVTGVLRDGHALEQGGWRGPVFVVLGILLFAATIRGLSLGSLNIPSLGLLVSGPLAIVVGGYATPEARLRDLVMLALTLTALCMLLFGDLLNLPIPLYPLSFAEMLPAAWSNDGKLRATAGGVLLLALALFLATRRHGPAGPIDVADHQVSPTTRARI